MTVLYVIVGTVVILWLAALMFIRDLERKEKARYIRVTERRIGDIYDYRWKNGETSEDDIKWLLETVEYHIKKEQRK